MHIRKLEISGFKSFVDKTVIHFDHDVIGIVGPNGCGKSNIVDAIRWCMGEQSAKHLRGRAMEDVIFNGSESRPQHGMAEVTLTFDNGDKTYAETLPPEYRDYPELAITRRLYRDGTSEYLINKTQVRLRDVTDLFLGTGVGTKAYSIVEQGRIGQIVSSRPQDRRLYIEEAAGITKYKLRRKQAERKLDLTKQNLLRVTDIVNEIDRTRSTLKRQAAKAERYISYRGELEDLFLHDAAHRMLEMIVVERAKAATHQDLTQRSSELQQRLTEGEASSSGAREEATQLELRFESATTRAAATEQRVTECKSEVARAQDRSEHLEQRLAQLGRERSELSERLERLESERGVLAERVTELSRDESSRDQEALAEQQALDALRRDEQEAAATLTELQRRSAAEDAETASLEARTESHAQLLGELQERRQQIERERCQIATDLQRLDLERQALADNLRELRTQHQGTAEETERLQQRLTSCRERAKSESKALQESKTELSHKRSRFNVLVDLHRRLEGVGAGTKVLLSSQDPAVVGLLADRVDVEARYTEAFASLLGDRLQCVIVRDPERGLELLDSLKQSKGGRATIATQRQSFVAGSRNGASSDPAVLTRLIDELLYQKEDEALIRALVGDAVVVSTAADALALNAKFPGTTSVALDGTVVREDGLVSGGDGDEVATAMLEQKREMRELELEIAERESQVELATASCAALEAELTELELQLTNSRKQLHERELAALRVEKDLSSSENGLKQAEQRHQRFVEEGVRLDERVQALELQKAEASERLTTLLEQRTQTRSALEQARERAAETREASSAKANEAMGRQVRLAQVREQAEAARATLTRLEQENDGGRQRLAQLIEDSNGATEQLELAKSQWNSGLEASEAARETAEVAQRDLDEVRRLLEQVRTGLAEHDGLLRTLRSELSEIEEQSRNSEMALQKLQIEREHLLSNVADRFRGLNLLRVIGDYHARPAPDGEHRRRIDELGKLIDRMGPVNLDAKAEYDDAERRFDELSTQRNDIQQALDELERAIRHMDRESKRRFRETFDTVNALFKKTFARLFKGGRGELMLTEPENLLETGVDIIAQPPGKKLGNIELMSGGEKALTATALIFAIFQHRPSPFCILDEVDAPLDDANVGRYNEAVRAMTSSSQFVLITHIKKTMQSVDVLYGVTMGEPGVSRVVSVKVNEAAAARSEKAPASLDAPPGVSAPETDATAVA